MVKRIGEKPNGCGCASGFLKWVKPPYATFFNDCCITHDRLYNEGGSERDRKSADLMLFRDMVELSVFKKSPLNVVWLTFVSLFYYWSVRIFGKHYFKYNSQ